MTPEALGNLLAPVNAFLNLTSFVCLAAGFWFIKKKKAHRHRRAMLGAVAASSLFLVFYVLRFSLTGTHRFAGEGIARTFYLSVLFSHMVLAVVVVPLVLTLLYLAFRSRFKAHSRLARWTFPVWAYVSFTGLLVYLLLYHVYGYVGA
jgi:putative membrane protein